MPPGQPPQNPPAQPAARRPPAPAPAGAIRRGDPRAPILTEGRRATYTASRSSRRTVMMIVGGLIVLAAVVIGVVSALGGSSGGKAKAPVTVNTATRTTATQPPHAHKTAASKSATKTPALSPAETTVAVLNATETEGLAGRTASALQQSGYSQAAAVYGKPPGSGQVSIVEYASGHQAEAEGVAHSAEVTHVQPMEAAVAALASSANVVLIVGADKATPSP
ncbi:MAG TPA: LytR C-terminal domain-containing protein [Solirubrobacteraceae bacterium]